MDNKTKYGVDVAAVAAGTLVGGPAGGVLAVATAHATLELIERRNRPEVPGDTESAEG